MCFIYTHIYRHRGREDKSVYIMLPLVLFKKIYKTKYVDLPENVHETGEKLREKSSVRGTLHVSPFVACENFFNEKNAN